MNFPLFSKGKVTSKILILTSGLVLLLIAGLGGIVFFTHWQIPFLSDLLGKKTVSSEEKKPPEKGQGFMYRMDPFMVNLADAGRLRYLKLRIEVESMEQKAHPEYEKRLPQMRDAILMILAGKHQAEITEAEGKRKLRDEIRERLNQQLTTFKIQTVYFIEFVIQ